MKINKIILLSLLSILLSACAESNKEHSISGGVADQEQKLVKGKPASKYLAYVHNLSIVLDKGKIPETHSQIISHCEQDEKYDCVILAANLNAGDYRFGNIKLRVKPDGVLYFSNLASRDGKVASSSLQSEDLSDRIIDTEKRIEMLESYRDKLILLETKPNDDIESLVRIASELSKVQNDLEYAKGKKAKLSKRVNTDILEIQLKGLATSSFWTPIIDSMGSFGDELSYGISSVVTSSAFLIPWFIFLIIVFLMLRTLYRFFNKK